MPGVAPDTRPHPHSPGRRRGGAFRLAACAVACLWGMLAWADRPFPGGAAATKPAPATLDRPRGALPAPPPRSLGAENKSLSAITPAAGTAGADFSVEKLLEDPLADVVIEGNKTIRTDAILRQIKTRPGRQASAKQVQEDVAQLLNTRWFFSVHPDYRHSDDGPVLVFKVVERPILKSVTFKGNKKIKTGELQAQTGLRAGHAYDVAANRESVNRVRQIYKDKGFRFVEVTLEKGSLPEEREVVINIVEGPKPKIWDINIKGGQFASSSILKTKIKSNTVILWLIRGDYDPEIVRNDVLALKQYYMSLGFFDVDVQVEEVLSEDKAKVTLNFVVDEGQRYKVDGIEVIGNDVITREKLLDDLKLKPGDFFNQRFLNEDMQKMTDLYDEQGRLFAKVMPTPRFREGEDPLVDVVYQIDEDVPRYVGAINIHIRGDYPHSREEVVRQQVNRFLKPGRLATSKDLQYAKARVSGSGLWDKNEPPVFDIKPNDGNEYWPKLAARGQDLSRDLLTETSDVRMQQPERVFGHSLQAVVVTVNAVPQSEEPPVTEPISFPAAQIAPAPRMDMASPLAPPTRRVQQASRALAPQATLESAPATDLPAERPSVVIPPDAVFRGQSEDFEFRGQSLDAYGQQVPQDYLQGNSPQGDPFGDALQRPAPGFVDVNIDVSEGRTGRLMFGVGVNSNAGVVGSIVLQEDNFDILRPPTSWSDIINGSAWRGAGQSFRLEAVPGTQVSRYMATWTDPFFLRSDFSLGVSAFYYQRFYQFWNEERVGGRISTGYILNRFWSANAALRIEDVGISALPTNPPPDLLAVRGDSLLTTGSVTLQYDARDNSFFPTRGQFLNGSYEQAFGQYVYPRFDLTGGKYFTTYERPDGFGKQILSLSGEIGWTGSGTPVFERFYAGGYSSFRGFYFRGVSPEVNNVKVGGDFIAVGTAEYSVPITANDNIRTVVFTDFGTVEPNAGFQNFRVAMGFGFRLTIPAMGPAPLAFDFSVPLARQSYDRTQVFSFYVGMSR